MHKDSVFWRPCTKCMVNTLTHQDPWMLIYTTLLTVIDILMAKYCNHTSFAGDALTRWGEPVPTSRNIAGSRPTWRLCRTRTWRINRCTVKILADKVHPPHLPPPFIFSGSANNFNLISLLNRHFVIVNCIIRNYYPCSLCSRICTVLHNCIAYYILISLVYGATTRIYEPELLPLGTSWCFYARHHCQGYIFTITLLNTD